MFLGYKSFQTRKKDIAYWYFWLKFTTHEIPTHLTCHTFLGSNKNTNIPQTDNLIRWLVNILSSYQTLLQIAYNIISDNWMSAFIWHLPCVMLLQIMSLLLIFRFLAGISRCPIYVVENHKKIVSGVKHMNFVMEYFILHSP